MKKRNLNILIIVLAVVMVGILALMLALMRGEEDTWLCQNGEWIKHGNPRASMPTEPCGKVEKTTEKPQVEGDIVVLSPKPNQTISSPLSIEGKVKGSWFFEAVFSVRLLDEEGKELAQGNILAEGDWMTENYVNFKTELSFIAKKEGKGTLVFVKANPSGLPEQEEEFSVPVNLVPTETTKVKVYFSNSKLDPEFTCNKVFSVEREVAKTETLAQAALKELLSGPTEKEKQEGCFTNLNPGVQIQSLTIENGVAKVDFDEQLEYQVGGSCKIAAIRQQITQTLKQFPTIQEVIISINGRTEDILQP